ncbi:MAG: hypothetical protein AAGE52_02770 [Myxococcota bacterium]
MALSWGICETLAVGDNDDRGVHAADEPTAMWDEDSLKDLGLDDVGRVSSPPSGPATSGAGPAGPSVQVSTAQGSPRGGLSWVITIVLAVVLGVGVFLLVRLLR